MTNAVRIAVAVGAVALLGLFVKYSSCQPGDSWPAHEGQLRQTARLQVDLNRTDHVLLTSAKMRAGPPVPFSIFIGATMTNAPAAGMVLRFATFSR